MLPAHAGTLPWFARIEASLAHGDRCEIEETAIELMETVAAVVSGHVRARCRLSAADEKRISAALRVVEQNFAEPILLDQLAATACMSKYHFLRTFRSVVGVTPHRYLLGLRLRNAALRLVKSSTPISAIAFDTGFGDICRRSMPAFAGNSASAHLGTARTRALMAANASRDFPRRFRLGLRRSG